jgi:hypothetical protein
MSDLSRHNLNPCHQIQRPGIGDCPLAAQLHCQTKLYKFRIWCHDQEGKALHPDTRSCTLGIHCAVYRGLSTPTSTGCSLACNLHALHTAARVTGRSAMLGLQEPHTNCTPSAGRSATAAAVTAAVSALEYGMMQMHSSLRKARPSAALELSQLTNCLTGTGGPCCLVVATTVSATSAAHIRQCSHGTAMHGQRHAGSSSICYGQQAKAAHDFQQQSMQGHSHMPCWLRRLLVLVPCLAALGSFRTSCCYAAWNNGMLVLRLMLPRRCSC